MSHISHATHTHFVSNVVNLVCHDAVPCVDHHAFDHVANGG